MKKFLILISALFAFNMCFSLSAYAADRELLVGGQPVGIRISTCGVTVAGFSQVETDSGSLSPARDAGIQQGDRITHINGAVAGTVEEISAAVSRSEGSTVCVTLARHGDVQSVRVTPALSCDGRWMLGLLLREGVTGIGTVTFIDPESGAYGALGHGISDSETGEVIPIRSGSVCDAQIVSVTPGTPGTPGELNGCSEAGAVKGTIERNTKCGIFGTMSAASGSKAMELGNISPGPASIISTVNGTDPQEYSVEVNRIFTESGCVHAMLTVTDPRLLAETGGIVQGMSGSPIIQRDKLVGAVTHVFVSDPTRGCAISIHDMLSAGGICERAA